MILRIIAGVLIGLALGAADEAVPAVTQFVAVGQAPRFSGPRFLLRSRLSRWEGRRPAPPCPA